MTVPGTRVERPPDRPWLRRFNTPERQSADVVADTFATLPRQDRGWAQVRNPQQLVPADMRMLRQSAANVDLQLTGLARVDPQGRKFMNHYGFISDDADADVAAATEWCEARNLEVMTGLYMPRMFWIDVPELFLDFVLEVMDADELKKYDYPWPPVL